MAGLMTTIRRRPFMLLLGAGAVWWLVKRSDAKDPTKPEPPPEPEPGETPVTKVYKSIVPFDQGGDFEVVALRGGNFCVTRLNDGAMEMYNAPMLANATSGFAVDARDVQMLRDNGYAGYIDVYKGAVGAWAFDAGEAEALWGGPVIPCESALVTA